MQAVHTHTFSYGSIILLYISNKVQGLLVYSILKIMVQLQWTGLFNLKIMVQLHWTDLLNTEDHGAQITLVT